MSPAQQNRVSLKQISYNYLDFEPEEKLLHHHTIVKQLPAMMFQHMNDCFNKPPAGFSLTAKRLRSPERSLHDAEGDVTAGLYTPMLELLAASHPCLSTSGAGAENMPASFINPIGDCASRARR